MILDDFKLQEKVAIVTGSSTGLGQSMAIGLAEAGADIVGIGQSSDSDETRKAVEELGRKFLFLRENLLSVEPVDRIIESTVKDYGRVDILVNNAGIIRRDEALEFRKKTGMMY